MTSIKDALEFYADPRRYQGANQRPIEGDKFARPDAVYIQDVTRDNGDIARRALATLTTPAPGRDEAAIYICYDGYGHYYINKERPANHVAIVYDEETAEKVVNLFNADAILSALPVAPVVDEAGIRADAELLDALIAADGLLQELGHSLPQVKAAIRAGGGER